MRAHDGRAVSGRPGERWSRSRGQWGGTAGLLMLGVFVTAWGTGANGDEIADVLEIENMTVATNSPAATHVEEAAPARQEAVARAPGDVAALIEALEAREQELEEAQAEIAKLKDVIRRIWEANRREQRNMHYNMGCVFKACKYFDKAEEAFLKALELDEDDPYIHYNLAILYDDDLKDSKKARWHYEKFLELAPDDKDAAKVYEWLSSLQ